MRAIKWRMKEGVGDHTMRGGKVIHPGEVIVVTEEELKGVKDKFIPLENPEEAAMERVKSNLKVVHRGGGKYLVVNAKTGKPFTDKLMTEAEAKELMNGTEGEGEGEGEGED